MLGSERDSFNMCCSYIQIHGKLVWGARICNGHVGTVYIWRKIWKINLSYFFPQGNSEHRYWDEQSVTLSSSYWWMWEHFQLTVDFFTERCLSLITPVFLTAFSPLFLEDKKKKNQVTHSAAQVCLGICVFASTSPNIFVYLPALSIVANDKTLTGPTSRSQLSPDVSVKEAPGGALKFYYVFTSAPRRGGGGGH